MKTVYKNILKGFGGFIIYLTITIIIPSIVFTIFKTIDFTTSINGLNITVPIPLFETKYSEIIFWLTATGLLVSGFAFLNYSSPKQSIRKGSFALVQVLINCLYIWSYRFSGALDVGYPIGLTGYVILYLENYLLLYMGIYFLTISIKIYDLLDFTINREKIRAERWKS